MQATISQDEQILNAAEDAAVNGSHRSHQAQKHIGVGLDMHRQGRLHEALAAYQSALDIDSEDAFGRYLAGLALKGLGLDGEANAEWCRANDLNTRDEESAWGLAMARKMLGSSA